LYCMSVLDCESQTLRRLRVTGSDSFVRRRCSPRSNPQPLGRFKSAREKFSARCWAEVGGRLAGTFCQVLHCHHRIQRALTRICRHSLCFRMPPNQRVFVAGAGITPFNQPGPSRFTCPLMADMLSTRKSLSPHKSQGSCELTILQPRIYHPRCQGRRRSSSQCWPRIAPHGCRRVQVRVFA